jgi:hypothetical protein
MEIENKHNHSIFLAPYWNLIIQTGGLGKKPFKIWKNWIIFFHEKAFVQVQIILTLLYS